MDHIIRLLAVPALAVATLAAFPVAAEAGPLTCGGLRVTIVGTAGNDTILGTSGADVIHAKGGDDRVRGRGGNDRICGGYGRDRLWGGDGNDRLYGGPDRLQVQTDGDERSVARAGDRLEGGAGNDYLDAGEDNRGNPSVVLRDVLSWEGSRRGVRLDMPTRRVTGDGTDRFRPGRVEFVLTRHDDRAIGGRGGDWIFTGAGDDVVAAYGGDDRIVVDAVPEQESGGTDVVRLGEGDDYLLGRAGNDRAWGGPGDDQLYVSGRANQLRGGSGDDRIHDGRLTTAGETYDGGSGHDSLYVGTSSLYVGDTSRAGTWDMASDEMVVAGSVRVPVSGFEDGKLDWGIWTVTGTDGPNTLTTAGATTFFGMGGDDTFTGSPEDDWFDGGDGLDVASWMRQGEDTCVDVEVVPPDCEHVSP